MDDANDKPLPPSERFKDLCNELTAGGFNDDTPLSPQERKEAIELRQKLVEFAKAYGAWLEAGKPLWGEKAIERNSPSEGGRER